MKKIHLLLSVIVMVITAGCSTPRHPAPIVDRIPPSAKVEVNAASALQTAPRMMDSQGNYVVRKGDSLMQIASDFGQNFRDIVAWNNLASPNDIKVDQVLRVTPIKASAGSAQTTSIASNSGIEVRSLTVAPTPAIVSVPNVPNKSAPRGEKQPYSEAVLAELQKPDAGSAASSTVQVPSDPKTSVDTTNTEDSTVVWMWPTDGKIIATFDQGKKGIDIAGKLGQQVLSASSGKVMYASSVRGYGNLVIVKHTNNLLSAYAHNKSILVKEGQSVSKGEKIAEMGNSDTDSVKLHFEIRQQGKPVDPSKFLPHR